MEEEGRQPKSIERAIPRLALQIFAPQGSHITLIRCPITPLQPALLLEEIEKHQSVEKLLSKGMNLVCGTYPLSGESLFQLVIEYALVSLEELVGDTLDAESFFMFATYDISSLFVRHEGDASEHLQVCVVYIVGFYSENAELKRRHRLARPEDSLGADKGKLRVVLSEREKIVSCWVAPIERFKDRPDRGSS